MRYLLLPRTSTNIISTIHTTKQKKTRNTGLWASPLLVMQCQYCIFTLWDRKGVARSLLSGCRHGKQRERYMPLLLLSLVVRKITRKPQPKTLKKTPRKRERAATHNLRACYWTMAQRRWRTACRHTNRDHSAVGGTREKNKKDNSSSARASAARTAVANLAAFTEAGSSQMRAFQRFRASNDASATVPASTLVASGITPNQTFPFRKSAAKPTAGNGERNPPQRSSTPQPKVKNNRRATKRRHNDIRCTAQDFREWHTAPFSHLAIILNSTTTAQPSIQRPPPHTIVS